MEDMSNQDPIPEVLTMSGPNTRPSRKTREAERHEAGSGAEAGTEPTPEEEEAAERNTPDDTVTEHYREMTDRGARQEGEGRLP
jgi:hypothetical protein